MGVSNYHSKYTANKETWQKNIDFMSSEKAVHDKGDIYCPPLGEQFPSETPENYEARQALYRKLTLVPLLAKRANKAMVGMIMRKQPSIQYGKNETMEELLKSCDVYGRDFNTFATETMLRFMTTGRRATMVGRPVSAQGTTLKQEEEQGIRPRLSGYDELNITNWDSEEIRFKEQLSMITLREDITVTGSDEFTSEDDYQFRVLDLAGDGTGGNKYFRQRLFGSDEELVPDSLVFPVMNNKKMSFIPLIIHGGIDVITPPLNEVVDANLHLYQQLVEERYGLRMSAIPTPYFFGVDPLDDSFPRHTGAGVVIGAKNPDCKTGFREFTGAGLSAVANKVQWYIDMITALSVQAVMDSPGNKTATEASIDYGNATASLTSISDMFSNDFTRILQIMADWAGVKEEVTCKFNTDFMPTGLSAQDFQALLAAYIQGTISYETYYTNLAKGEITDSEKTPEEELQEIGRGIPAGLNK